MSMSMPAPACLAEDELLALGGAGSGRSLADAPEAEAHLAACATCSALLAAIVRDAAGSVNAAGAAGAAGLAWGALAGEVLGPYRLEVQIGAGGMGAVYRARDERLGRAVAVKVLHRPADAAAAARFAAEARAAAAIDHPSIVAIHDAGEHGGVMYLAMELVDGETVRSLVTRGLLQPGRVTALAVELARGLAAAHARGVIHRDLKPENLLVTRDGRLKILDFGLAKLADPAYPLDETAPGTVQGTAGYMAPEQARGEPADARADLFAAGAIVYELATGRRAFDGATHADRLSAVLRDTPPLDEAGPLAPILARCLAKEPRDRFHAAADLAWALEAIAVAPANAPAAPAAPAAPSRRPSRRALLAGGGAALLAGAGGFLLGRRRGAAPPPPPPPSPSSAVSIVPAAPRETLGEFRPLTHRAGRIFTARFTRDGSRLVYGAAWDAEPPIVHALDLASFEEAVLELPPADILSTSRTGELALCLGRRFTDHQSSTGTLAVVPLAGGAPRTLQGDVEEADYAPDGALLVLRRTPTGSTIALLPPAALPAASPSPAADTTLVESRGWITHARISPDGARLAYLEHPSAEDDAGELRVVELDPGARAPRTPRVLGGTWASLAGLAWDPSGELLWLTAARANAANALHRIPLSGDAPALISQTTGRLRLHDVAADRRAAVTADTWRLRTVVGGPGKPTVDRSRSDMSLVTDLSTDGATLVVGELGATAQGVAGYLVPVAGGRALRVGAGLPYALSPSGARVLAGLSPGGDQLVVYATATAERIPLTGPGPLFAARWLDEAALVASGLAPNARPRLWRLSLGTAPAPLTDEGDAGAPALDPARRRCAFVDARGALHVLDLAAGTRTTLPGDFRRRVACGWLARGAIVLRTATTPLALVAVDPATGATSPLLSIDPPPLGLKSVDSFVLRGDAALWAYSYGSELSQLFLTTLPA
jgi:hypothetical protein